jgi:hypothetical protein
MCGMVPRATRFFDVDEPVVFRASSSTLNRAEIAAAVVVNWRNAVPRAAGHIESIRLASLSASAAGMWVPFLQHIRNALGLPSLMLDARNVDALSVHECSLVPPPLPRYVLIRVKLKCPMKIRVDVTDGNRRIPPMRGHSG